MAAEGLKLERLIGPQTAHKYEPATKKELIARLEKLADTGLTLMTLRGVGYLLKFDA